MASSQDERWCSVFDPKLAGLLSELELGLGSVVRQSGAQPSKRRGNSEEDVLGKREKGRQNKLGKTICLTDCFLFYFVIYCI